jgi:adenylate cyclase
MGLTYIATWFFQEDSSRRIQEVTSDKSQVISLKVKTDVKTIIEKGNLIAATFSSEIINYDKKSPRRGNGRRSAGMPDSNLFRDRIISRESGIIYFGLAGKRNGSIDLIASAINNEVIKSLQNPEPDFGRIMKEESPFIEKSFNGVIEIHNASSHFGSPVLRITIPLEAEDKGSSSKVIIIYFSMNTFLEAIQSFSEYQTFIVNGSGELIAHPDSNLMLQNIDFSGSEIVQSLMKSPADNGQSTYTDEQGVVRMGSFRKIDIAGIGIVTTVDRDVALEAVYNLRRRNIFITTIILMFTIIIVYIFAKTLTGPIKRLVSASTQIKEGNYHLTLKPSSRDEIGDLTESFLEMGRGLEEREKMKEAFGKFVNKEIAELAMKGELKLGGERKTAAIFFSDIRSFTEISEKLEPEEVVEFLNEYMTEMVNCVNNTHGVVDKFIGDAVMAVWGTPVSHGNDTENAINGALMMRKALIKFNKNRGGVKKPVIKIGCGINTGPVLAGQIGSQDRMEYTVIGDTVNLASRIEALNKPFGTDILISEDAYALVRNIFIVEPMRKITVKGKTQPQQIYAVIGRRGDPEDPRTIAEVRKLLGIADIDISKIDLDAKEEKYEISR